MYRKPYPSVLFGVEGGEGVRVVVGDGCAYHYHHIFLVMSMNVLH